MNFEEYLNEVVTRYSELDEKQKESIRKFKETKNGQLMMDLLGPEFRPIFNRLGAPKQKKMGLADRV